MSKWTTEETEFFKNNSTKIPIKEIAEILNKSCIAVESKAKKLKISRRLETLVNTNCLVCGKEIIDHKLTNRKFCSHSCSATYNNKARGERNRIIRNCKNCGKETANKKFCSPECAFRYKSVSVYKSFLDGTLNIDLKTYNPKSFKKYFLEEQDHKCAICNMEDNWNGKEIHFILDHIDGNSQNNTRLNLRLVCPNCDSQLPTFKSRNKNSGRYYRRKRYAEGKSY